ACPSNRRTAAGYPPCFSGTATMPYMPLFHGAPGLSPLPFGPNTTVPPLGIVAFQIVWIASTLCPAPTSSVLGFLGRSWWEESSPIRSPVLENELVSHSGGATRVSSRT